jgi:hypothetical protein
LQNICNIEEKTGYSGISKAVALCMVWMWLEILISTVRLLSLKAARTERLLRLGAKAGRPE